MADVLREEHGGAGRAVVAHEELRLLALLQRHVGLQSQPTTNLSAMAVECKIKMPVYGRLLCISG